MNALLSVNRLSVNSLACEAVRESCIEMSGHIHLRSFWNCQSCGSEPSLDTVRPVSQLLQLYTPAATVALFAQVLRSHLLSLVVLGCVSILASLAPSLGSSPLSPH